jgi:molecular chaperone HtpG
VLLLHDRIDEWVVSSLHEFEGKPLQSVAKAGLDLSKIGGEAPKPEERSRRASRAR